MTTLINVDVYRNAREVRSLQVLLQNAPQKVIGVSEVLKWYEFGIGVCDVPIHTHIRYRVYVVDLREYSTCA